MFDVPVLLIIFNRPEPTEKLIDALRIVKPGLIFVSADGPRENAEADVYNCEAARKVIEKIDWDCKIEKLYHTNNQGCHWAPRKALSWFFTHVEEGIILEDDCIPEKDFFFFCKELLSKYRDDDRILTINGSNLGYELKNNYSYTFSRFMNMWGWATWRRAETKIDYSLKEWKKEKNPLLLLYKKLRHNVFDIDMRWLEYWERIFNVCLRKDVSTWDWQWMNYQILNNKFSIVPAVNLVTNMGFNEMATHTKLTANLAANIPVKPLKFPIVHPSKIEIDKEYEEKYVKWVWCSIKRLRPLSQAKLFITRLLQGPPKD